MSDAGKFRVERITDEMQADLLRRGRQVEQGAHEPPAPVGISWFRERGPIVVTRHEWTQRTPVDTQAYTDLTQYNYATLIDEDALVTVMAQRVREAPNPLLDLSGALVDISQELDDLGLIPLGVHLITDHQHCGNDEFRRDSTERCARVRIAITSLPREAIDLLAETGTTEDRSDADTAR